MARALLRGGVPAPAIARALCGGYMATSATDGAGVEVLVAVWLLVGAPLVAITILVEADPIVVVAGVAIQAVTFAML
jgi:hypothetical protein